MSYNSVHFNLYGQHSCFELKVKEVEAVKKTTIRTMINKKILTYQLIFFMEVNYTSMHQGQFYATKIMKCQIFIFLL